MARSSLLRPEYLFRPGNVLRRLRFRPPPGQPRQLYRIRGTPLTMEASPNEHLGRNLHLLGMYDLALSEAILRLTPPGGTAIDVGANIGYTALLMGHAVGTSGRVLAFEPLPKNFTALQANLARNGLRHVQAHPYAISDENAQVTIELPEGFERNEGILSLEKHAAKGAGGSSFTLETRPLGGFLQGISHVHLMKIDVEGHEPKVLAGAAAQLAAGAIDVVLYEDHHNYPSQSSAILEQHGYRVFRLLPGLFGPKLQAAAQPAELGLEPNWIAARDPATLQAALSPRGWRVL
jgi:FkbM family methyltransferase